MGPEWWLEAFDLAEAEREGAWAALTDAQRDEAVAEVIRGQADQLRAVSKEQEVSDG